jgi:hypothetical protein
MFKRRRGRTYHIRTVHANLNARPAQEDLHEDGDDIGHTNGTGTNTGCQRKEHPHLTGMCAHDFCLSPCADHFYTTGNK